LSFSPVSIPFFQETPSVTEVERGSGIKGGSFIYVVQTTSYWVSLDPQKMYQTEPEPAVPLG